MTDKEIRQKILVYLHNIFKTDPTSFKSTDEIGSALGILHIESKRAIVYLHQKGWIDQNQDDHYNWHQKINANGIDELERLESESKPIIIDTDNKIIRINILEYLKYHYGKEFSGEPELHDLILDLDLASEDATANLRYMEEKGWVESFAGQSDTSYQLTTKGMDALDRLNSKDNNVTPPSKKLKNNLTSDKIKSVEQITHDGSSSKLHDFFICHATEDKEVVARPLAKKLDELGLDVWYDEFSLRWGSKLMKTITKGIRESRFGIVILSPKFFEKTWAQLELDALVGLLKLDDGELLPLLYNLTHEQAKENLPLLSGILYRTWDEGLDQLAMELKDIANGKIEGFRKMNVIKTMSVSKTNSDESDLADMHTPVKRSSREISPQNKDLLQNVYEPAYDQLKKAYDNQEFIAYTSQNPWEGFTPSWRLKTEPEMVKLFEEFGKELRKYQEMWIDFGNKFSEKRDILGNMLIPVFTKHGLLDQNGNVNAGGILNPPREWLHNCQDVIFNDGIQNGDELYQILKKDAARHYGDKYSQHLDEWKNKHPTIFTDLWKIIPELVEELGTKYSYSELDIQRNILKNNIKKLTLALEEKLKGN